MLNIHAIRNVQTQLCNRLYSQSIVVAFEHTRSPQCSNATAIDCMLQLHNSGTKADLQKKALVNSFVDMFTVNWSSATRV